MNNLDGVKCPNWLPTTAGLMQFDIDTAINLLAIGDTVGLIGIYQKLKEWEL